MKVIFVGSNPAWASTSSKAFDESTKSGRILRGWTSHLHGEFLFRYLNVCDKPTPNNRPLKRSEIKENLPQLTKWIEASKFHSTHEIKLVALGKTAAIALTLLRLDFYEMPHPSGLNRLLNDPTYVADKIKGLQEYCKPSKD